MHIFRFTLFAAAAFAAAPALAEAAADADPASIIVTGTRDRAELPDVSGAMIFAGKLADVSLLTDLPLVAERNLRVALADIPGMLVSEVSNGSWASLSYRGLGEPHESWNILTLADAVPAVPDMYSYPAGYFIPPLELIERVEFIRGGAGLLHGPQPGGALNYVTRGPLRDAGANALLRGSYGRFDSATGLASAQISNGRFGADGYLHHARSDGPRRANSDAEQTSAQARAYAASDTLTAVLAFDYYQGRFGEPGGLNAARFAADPRDVSTGRDRLFIRRAVPSLSVDWQADDATQLTARLWTSHYERTSWRQAGGAFGQPTPDANVLIRQTQRFRTYAADLRGRRDFGPHSLTLGVLAHSSDAPVTVDKGASNADFAGSAGALARAERSGDTFAAFGELRLGLGDVQIVPGFRLERLRQRVTETLDLGAGSATGGPPGGPNGALSARRDAQWVPLWGLGATWDAAENLRFVANASRGFKPKLYNDGVTFQAGVDAAGEFEASYATTVEAGVQARPAPAVRLDASLFRIAFEDQVGFLAGPLAASPPFGAVGAGGARRQTVGSMRNQGLDLSASVDLIGQRGLSPTEAGTLRAGVNLQLLDATFTDGPARGQRPQYAPEHLVRATLQWLGARGGRAAFVLTGVGRQNGSDNGAPEFDIPAYTVADISAEVPVGDVFSLGGGVTNLFDERYVGRIRPGGGGGIDPGRPRAAYVSLTARL